VNGLIDIFAPGELISPEVADINFVPVPVMTPAVVSSASLQLTPSVQPIHTSTPTLLPSATLTPIPPTWNATQRVLSTRTPRPSPTPYQITSPITRKDLNRMVAVTVVIIGIIFWSFFANFRRFS
jgi:hypothetical protein